LKTPGPFAGREEAVQALMEALRQEAESLDRDELLVLYVGAQAKLVRCMTDAQAEGLLHIPRLLRPD
jgi:hypothetical protein